MDDPLRQEWLEKRMGHKVYGRKQNWGLISIGLVLFVAVCGLAFVLSCMGKIDPVTDEKLSASICRPGFSCAPTR